MKTALDRYLASRDRLYVISISSMLNTRLPKGVSAEKTREGWDLTADTDDGYYDVIRICKAEHRLYHPRIVSKGSWFGIFAEEGSRTYDAIWLGLKCLASTLLFGTPMLFLRKV